LFRHAVHWHYAKAGCGFIDCALIISHFLNIFEISSSVGDYQLVQGQVAGYVRIQHDDIGRVDALYVLRSVKHVPCLTNFLVGSWKRTHTGNIRSTGCE